MEATVTLDTVPGDPVILRLVAHTRADSVRIVSVEPGSLRFDLSGETERVVRVITQEPSRLPDDQLQAVCDLDFIAAKLLSTAVKKLPDDAYRQVERRFLVTVDTKNSAGTRLGMLKIESSLGDGASGSRLIPVEVLLAE
jgi:hypothetical protein